MLPKLCRQTPNDKLCFDSIKGALDTLGKGRELFSEVITLVTMYYVLPASSAKTERSFSSLRRLKTYLRYTMTETRINNLLVLHVHKKRTDTLDVKDVTMQFVFDTKTESKHFARILTAEFRK